MSQLFANLYQSTSEVKTYTVDFTSELPAAITVVSASATHTPPGGGTPVTPAISVISPYVYVTVPAIVALGVNYVDVLATFSNGDKSPARLIINVVYPTTTARISMANNINLLRNFTAAGVNDYTLAATPYWSDKQIQDVLDRHTILVRREIINRWPRIQANGSVGWFEYRSMFRFFESYDGTSTPDRFYLQDPFGAMVATAAYTPDFTNGLFVFGADTHGTSYWLSGQSFDMNGAAADVWAQKASHYAEAYNFATDSHNLQRGQLIEHCLTMAKQYRADSGVPIVRIGRSDTDGAQDDTDERMTRHTWAHN